MNKLKECKGCNIVNKECILNPSFKEKDSNHTHYCPCQICLIKCMCKECCNNFKIYSTDYYDYMKKTPIAYKEYMHKLKETKNLTLMRRNYNITYMRGLPMIIKYQDVKESLQEII